MVHSPLPRPGLLGRQRECDSLERLVACVRLGQSGVLVLRGEAGVGKTALLEHLSGAAAGFRIARAAGVESEMELPFAGLHGLCAPMLTHLRGLPGPQRTALSTAFGLDTGPPPDRFMVGLAVLSLLADVAEQQPLLCIVDDAQWLDRVSAETLAFVARRLLAEPIGLVFAVREDGEEHALGGLPELAIGGIAADDARMLLDATIPGPLDERVRARILAEASGNPLALLELPRGLTPAAVAGGFGLPGSMPLISRIEQGFVDQLRPLPSATRQMLLLAAAEPVGDVTLLRRAADLLGIEPRASAPAEAAGLIDIGARVRFRHPLVRSAAYRAAKAPDRRDAHRTLADATDPRLDPDRRAWHRAQAAMGRDEAVAEELVRSAGRAQARGGVAAAAAFLARAAELTPDAARRGERALAAAQAKFESGALEFAQTLLAGAEQCPLDELQRARLARLRAEIVFVLRRGNDAPPLLLDAARAFETLDPAAARETYLKALEAALITGRLNAVSGVREAAEAARAAPAAPRPPRSIDRILDGMATRFTEGPGAGAPPLRRALQGFMDERLDDREATLRWLSLCPVVQSMTVFELWDDDAYETLATRSVRLARETGALTTLAMSLPFLAGLQMFSGDFPGSEASIQESDAIRAATGGARVVLGGLGLCAWLGAEAEAMQLINARNADATVRGEGRVLAMAGCCIGILYNGLGRYDAAIDGALRGSEDDDQMYVGWSLVELIEAATRGGRPEFAASALQRLQERARAAGTDWALGVLARSEALISEGDRADTLYREAIERLGRTRIRVELARAHLLYGEWLRRTGQRVAAREQLRTAHERFADFGAGAFAERARRELLATGETVRRRTSETRDVLTPQEAQIARLAADGQTNPEIGAQLFISPRTVEYHLRKVFAKLGIDSRRELSGLGTLAAPTRDQAR
ncbi:LuxR C-terminal-related transcriptional regulator [Solirubrobacter ginsenosidimutans]|uniref:LuxR C-terminal-related transcriptional regulator n=1 Tax=Solirubrobacter ginsenosidimutans TaxID=490573 RepID=A0A9X3MQ58_9ACTN|nr:LuxR family transcriptional regulator [Solirubrobacter ginsenosidimutans]MDA0159817.1 LuxR C-terminal-related transcriptional regulator [Solirubrobacter ginsenosidimutans]